MRNTTPTRHNSTPTTSPKKPEHRAVPTPSWPSVRDHGPALAWGSPSWRPRWLWSWWWESSPSSPAARIPRGWNWILWAWGGSRVDSMLILSRDNYFMRRQDCGSLALSLKVPSWSPIRGWVSWSFWLFISFG